MSLPVYLRAKSFKMLLQGFSRKIVSTLLQLLRMRSPATPRVHCDKVTGCQIIHVRLVFQSNCTRWQSPPTTRSGNSVCSLSLWGVAGRWVAGGLQGAGGRAGVAGLSNLSSLSPPLPPTGTPHNCSEIRASHIFCGLASCKFIIVELQAPFV